MAVLTLSGQMTPDLCEHLKAGYMNLARFVPPDDAYLVQSFVRATAAADLYQFASAEMDAAMTLIQAANTESGRLLGEITEWAAQSARLLKEREHAQDTDGAESKTPDVRRMTRVALVLVALGVAAALAAHPVVGLSPCSIGTVVALAAVRMSPPSSHQ